MKDLVIFKIKNSKNGKFASVHRGIDFVNGQGKSWTTRHGVRDAIINALLGYCGSGNNISPNDLRIVSLSAKGIKEEGIKEFLNGKELEEVKKGYLEQAARDNFYHSTIFRELCKGPQSKKDDAHEQFVKRFIAIHDNDWYDLVHVDKDEQSTKS